MRNSVAISLVVPVYNTEKYIAQCLDSILHQTLQRIEIIVVNDGSTDDSKNIIENFRQKDDRLKVFHIANGGVSAARNYGVEQACGKYVMFVDSDDWIAPDMCAILYDKAEKFNVDFVICGNYNVSTVAVIPRKIFPDEKIFVGLEYEREIVVSTLGLVGDKIKSVDRLDRLTPIWARLYKRSIIKRYNIHFIDLNKLPSECLQFNFEFALKAKKALYVDQALYYYRRNTQMSVTKPFRDNLLGKWNWWIDYMNEFIRDNCNAECYWKAFYSRICTSVIPLGGNALKLDTIRERLKECEKILDDRRLSEAFAKTDFSSCKFYWRVFFYVASKRCALFFLLLTWCMRMILKLRKS